MDVFTPNTGQTKNLLSGEERAELRSWITKGGRHILIGDDEGGSSGGAGGGRVMHHHDPGTRGGKSAKKVDKSDESGKIKKRPKSLKIGIKEYERLSHQIATDFPDLKADGEIHNYENRNHFYRFSVNGLGNYSYHLKIKIVGNEDYINSIRKKGK